MLILFAPSFIGIAWMALAITRERLYPRIGD
jgi:hypothetical protein